MGDLADAGRRRWKVRQWTLALVLAVGALVVLATIIARPARGTEACSQLVPRIISMSEDNELSIASIGNLSVYMETGSDLVCRGYARWEGRESGRKYTELQFYRYVDGEGSAWTGYHSLGNPLLD